MRLTCLPVSLFIIFSWSHTPVVSAEVLGRLSDKEQIYDAELLGGQLWYASQSGLFSIRGAEKRRCAAGISLGVAKPFEEFDEIWFGTTAGLYIVDSQCRGQKRELKLGDGTALRGVSAIHVALSGDVLAGSRSGLASLRRTHSGAWTAERVSDSTGVEFGAEKRVVSLVDFSGRTLIVTTSELYVYNGGGRVSRLPVEVPVGGGAEIKSAMAVGNRAFILTALNDEPHEAFYIQKDTLEAGGAVFGPLKETGNPLRTISVQSAGSREALLGTTDGIFLMRDNGTIQVVIGQEDFRAMRTVDMQPARGPAIVDYIGNKPDSVGALAALGDDLWFEMGEELFRYASWREKIGLSSSTELLAGGRHALGVRGFLRNAVGTCFVWGKTGLYRSDQKSNIEFSTSLFRIWGLLLNIGAGSEKLELDKKGENPPQDASLMLEVSRVRYSGPLADLGIRPEFSVKVEGEHESVHSVNGVAFVPLRGVGRFAGTEMAVIDKKHIEILDDIGNSEAVVLRILSFRGVFLSVLVVVVTAFFTAIGSLIALWLLTAVISLLTASTSIAISPRFLPGMLVVNSRFLRNRATFGLIPLFLLLAPIRRYVLRRYIRNLKMGLKEGRFAGGGKGGDPRALVRDLLLHLRKERSVLIVGGEEASQIALLRELASMLAFRTTKTLPEFSLWSICARCSRGRLGEASRLWQVRCGVPVLIELDIYLFQCENDPTLEALEEGILHEFANYGDINDVSLGKYFLDNGGFVFCLVGFDGLCRRCRHVVSQFIRKYGRENFILLSTASPLEGNWHFGEFSLNEGGHTPESDARPFANPAGKQTRSTGSED